MTSPPEIDYFVHPFSNPDLADGFGSTGYWEGGKYVHRAHPHRGLDYPQATGTAIRAVAHGRVDRIFWSDALGHVTVLRHVRPGDAPDVFSGYCHQSEQKVIVGQVIQRGQVIGEVGATGSEASGPHLHLTMSHHPKGVEGPDANFNPALFISHNDRETLAAAAAKAKAVKVKKDDNLSVLAERAGISLSTIKQLNPAVKGPDFVIHPGEKVRVR